jgi:hypothetical protein
MTELELREKLINKTAEMADKIESIKDLQKCAEVYGILTKETWATALTKAFEDAKNPPENSKMFQCGCVASSDMEGLK